VRTQKQLAYERRRRQERTRKQQRAAKLLAQGMTQQAVAAELGVTTHTLRNWKSAPAFQRELERQRARAARKPASAPASERKPRPKREPARRRARARKPDPATGQQPEPAAAAANQPAIELDDGVPIFPDTAEGYTARVAYYEARKLNNLPSSGYDYTVAKRGELPPPERRARERRDNRRRQ
jgi:transcriptional regulator with XRE-family HTH domain